MKTRDLKYIRSATTTLHAGFHFEQGKERTGPRGTDSSRAPETPRTAQGMGHISPSCSTASNVLDVKQSMVVSLISSPIQSGVFINLHRQIDG